MTLSLKLSEAIAQLQAVVADVESAEKGKLKPSVRARKELLTISKSLNGIRKELLEISKAEKAKRKAEKEANPKKKYATGFAIKKA
jgi:hypothetical protein